VLAFAVTFAVAFPVAIAFAFLSVILGAAEDLLFFLSSFAQPRICFSPASALIDHYAPFSVPAP